MKRLLFLLLFFASPLLATTPDTITSSVCFQDSQANCLASGQLTLDLSQPARVTSGGGQVAPLRVSVTLDSTGKIPAGTLIWGNDQLTPSGTTYHLRVFNSNGLLASDIGVVIIQGASPVDLSQLTPVSVNPTVSTNAAITTANNVFTGAPGITEQNSGGTFTSAQEYMQSLLNGCNPNTEFGTTQAGGSVIDALTGCVAVPNGATRQANAVAGYGTSTSGTVVGGYFQARPLANGVFADAINPVWQDLAGLTTGVKGGAVDINVNPQNAPGVYPSGNFGVNVALGAPTAGTYAGAAYSSTIFGANPGIWGVTFNSGDKSAVAAFAAGTKVGTVSVTSQDMLFNYIDSGSTKHQVSFNVNSVGAFAFGAPLAAPTLNLVTNGTGLQIFNTTTTCTTGASVGATCTTAAISLPVAEADTSYRVACTGKGLTNVPVVIATANSSATQFTITIAALTAAAASFTSYDCVAGHN